MAGHKILVTGATGFLGTNLRNMLEDRFPGEYEIYGYNSRSNLRELDDYTRDCEFVFHFAAIHRPKDDSEFAEVNVRLFETLLSKLRENGNACPVLYTSSIQADNGTPYGASKTAAEVAVRKHAEQMNSRYYIYRLTNTFGPGARPNGHSVVATFCHNIARGLPIQISNTGHVMRFYYVEDVMESFLDKLMGVSSGKYPYEDLGEDKTYTVTLGELAQKIRYFQECRGKSIQPALGDGFEKNLYKTFASYCEEQNEDC